MLSLKLIEKCGLSVLTILLLASLSGCGGGERSGSAAALGGDKSGAGAQPGLSIEDQRFEANPDSDPFYAQPKHIPDEPGTILNSRPIQFRPAGVLKTNPAWQLQYVTRDTNGNPVAAVTTVIQPTLPSTYGQNVLLSYQYAYDSLSAECSPSKTATGATRNQTNLAQTAEFLPGLDALGWTVVLSDYEGPRHAFGAGRLSGQATLDGIRAALAFEPLGLASNTPVAMWGYSGGGLATTWAAALQPQYAPELSIVGAAVGGPAIDLFDIARRQEDMDQFNFLFSVMIGIRREYPQLIPGDLLTERGREAVEVLREACVGDTGDELPNARMSDYIAADDPYSTPGFVAVMPEVTLLNRDEYPISDLYFYHEVADELVPVEGSDALVEQWCSKGATIHYNRSSAATLLDNPAQGVHVMGAAVGTAFATTYLNSRFAGASSSVTPPGTVRCN